jgi:hypothetical protein
LKVTIIVIHAIPFTIWAGIWIADEQRVGVQIANTGPASLNIGIADQSAATRIVIDQVTIFRGVPPEDAIGDYRRAPKPVAYPAAIVG